MPWTCPSCTLVNEDSDGACTACGTAKPTYKKIQNISVKELKQLLNHKQVNRTSAVEKGDLINLLIKSLSPQELKYHLAQMGKNVTGAVEKGDLVRLLQNAQTKGPANNLSAAFEGLSLGPKPQTPYPKMPIVPYNLRVLTTQELKERLREMSINPNTFVDKSNIQRAYNQAMKQQKQAISADFEGCVEKIIRISTLPPAGGAQTPSGRFRGLINLGNTCYMSSGLQALFSDDVFARMFLRKSGYLPMLRGTAKLSKALIALYSACAESPMGTQIRDDDFKTTLGTEVRVQVNYRDFDQKDSNEFITHLLDKVGDEIGYPDGYPTLNFEGVSYPQLGGPLPSLLRNHHGVIYGKRRSCNNCGTIKIQEEYEPLLRLPIPGPKANGDNLTLLDLLERFIRREEGDMRTCDTCGNNTARTEKFSLRQRAPEMLIMNLMRFDTSVQPFRKDNTYVDIPTFLETLAPLVELGDPIDTPYILNGIVYHMGHAGGGHYIATVRNPDPGNSWLNINDKTIRSMSNKDFLAELATVDKTGSGFTPYTLVYSKVTPERVQQEKQNYQRDKPERIANTTWACTSCTLINPHALNVCQVCEKPKAGGGSLAKHRKTKRRKYTKRRRACRTRCIKKQNRS
jgi:ubiquitin C-terminal hydrolase